MTDKSEKRLNEWFATGFGNWYLPEVLDVLQRGEELPGFDCQSEFEASSSKVLLPLPHMPPGWTPSQTEVDSIKRAGAVCNEYLEKFGKIDPTRLEWLSFSVSRIVLNYWVDKRYDDQLKPSEVKQELISVSREIEHLRIKLASLSSSSRSTLDSRLKRRGDNESVTDLIKKLSAFSILVDRCTEEIKSEKLPNTAIETCLSSFSALWEKATGKSRLRFAFVERVCEAMDPELNFKQTRWRMKRATQAKKRLK